MKPLLLLALLASISLPFDAISQEPSKPIPEDAVAILDGDPIAKTEYLEYLYGRFGKRGVRDMIGDILITREAENYGIQIDFVQLEADLKEREENARKGVSDEVFLENIQRNGQTYELYIAGLKRDLSNDQFLKALVLKTRVATDEKIKQFFERQYGLGGVKMKVRHILVMPNILRADLVRGGTKPADIDMTDLKNQARQIAEQARKRLSSDESFEAVAAELSHDRVTKDRGGVLENYNGRLYGPTFKAALDHLQPGQISGVVESGSGFHVVEMMGRDVTALDQVREEIVSQILLAEPTYQEMAGFRNSLVDSADLQLW